MPQAQMESSSKSSVRSGVSGKSQRIVITTFGSLGDLHPYIAIALELRQRGHIPVIATTDYYRQNVESEGIEFHHVRPDSGPIMQDETFFKRILDPRKGIEVLLNEFIIPNLRDSYADLKPAVEGADCLITHPLSFAGPILAEQTGLPWVSTMLSPLSLMSAYDFPIFANAPGLSKLRIFGPIVTKRAIAYGHKLIAPWSEPIQKFRAELGMKRGLEPLMEGQHSPDLALALFSSVMGVPQRDWPAQVKQTGFPFYDRRSDEPMPPELENFLSKGPAPIVFTLGSAAVMEAGEFYRISATAARRINKRAVLLVGKEPKNRAFPLPPNVVVFDYAPFSELFPKAAAIVHSGGIGSTAQALRAGKPMLVHPFTNDQFDNAARVKRLGVGRTLTRQQYTELHVGAEILRVITDPPFTQRAAEIGKKIQAEDGTSAACDAIEAYLATKARKG